MCVYIYISPWNSTLLTNVYSDILFLISHFRGKKNQIFWGIRDLKGSQEFSIVDFLLEEVLNYTHKEVYTEDCYCLATKSSPTLATPRTVAFQAPLSM